jgi:hypothetical protein
VAALTAAIDAATAADTDPQATQLLRQACELYPQSARLADGLGRALQQRGAHAESADHDRRAREIQETARLHTAEFPRAAGSLHRWELIEHIRRHPLPE